VNPLQLESSLDELLWFASGEAVRSRSRAVYQLALEGGTAFKLHPAKLDTVADRILSLMKRDYPNGDIPFHSRWVHFQAGGIDRLAMLEQRLEGKEASEKVRAKLDLATISVLLDAGAGPEWKFTEDGRTYGRSEGLAVASFHAFLKGRYSADPKNPLRVDGSRLQTLTPQELADDFQVSATNPLIGVEPRTELLKRLGTALTAPSNILQRHGQRPGALLDYWQELAASRPQSRLRGNDILRGALLAFHAAWTPKVTVDGIGFGDAWEHPALSGPRVFDRLVPFHKLSQWLSYSLMEPVQELGITIESPDDLTGLPEYRNGGLFLDLGVLEAKSPKDLDREHRPEDLFLIEWRALTVTLLDELAVRVRARLGLDASKFPLVKLLQAGTWQAGREVAAELRPGGPPPLRILSDGTVF